MEVSSRAVLVVGVNHGLIGQLSRGEYSTGIFPSAAVDPVTVKAVHVPGQRKHDRTLKLELVYNPRAAPFESVAVFGESRQGEKNGSGGLARAHLSQQHLNEAVAGLVDKVSCTIPFDRAGWAIGNAQFLVAFSVIGHAICCGRHVSRRSTIEKPGLISYLPSRHPFPHCAQNITALACLFGLES